MTDQQPAAQTVQACEGMMPAYRLPQADARVNYREAGESDEQKCLSCRFYQYGGCSLVEGTIEAPYVCDLWLGAPMVWMVSQDGRRRLFSEIKLAAEPPEWLPLLPKPGQYSHPTYGTLDLTREKLGAFAAGINAQVYQPKLVVNAEHENDTDGALGWIVEARQNDDGSVDARVEWTDRGREAIERDRFAYVSPEWMDSWTDAVGQAHENVVVGAALTVRPFFKAPYLRPLAAGETHHETWAPSPRWLVPSGWALAPEWADRFIATDPPQPAVTGTTPPEVTMSDTQTGAGAAPPTTATDLDAVKTLTDRLTAIEAELTATKAAKESSDAAIKTLTEQNVAMQRDARRKRFTDEVMGKAPESGAMWAGEIAKNVSVLETLADAVGEDSETFKDFIAQQRATAAQLKASGLFTEIGSNQSGAAGAGAWERIEAEARKVASDEKVSFEVATGLVMERNPRLYSEYIAEQKGG